MLEIRPAVSEDLPTILSLYDKAIEFQRTVFHKTWLGFDRHAVVVEINEGRLWKILESGEIACIYSVTYEDPIIWGEHSHESAMYIHRIVTNPDFRGRAYVRTITQWALEHARKRGLRFVRMDTWGDNQKLIEYYRDCGFNFLGVMSPADSPTLPPHYRGIELGLLEIDLNNDPASVQLSKMDRRASAFAQAAGRESVCLRCRRFHRDGRWRAELAKGLSLGRG